MAVHDELSLAQNVKYEDVTPAVPIMLRPQTATERSQQFFAKGLPFPQHQPWGHIFTFDNRRTNLGVTSSLLTIGG